MSPSLGVATDLKLRCERSDGVSLPRSLEFDYGRGEYVCYTVVLTDRSVVLGYVARPNKVRRGWRAFNAAAVWLGTYSTRDVATWKVSKCYKEGNHGSRSI